MKQYVSFLSYIKFFAQSFENHFKITLYFLSGHKYVAFLQNDFFIFFFERKEIFM